MRSIAPSLRYKPAVVFAFLLALTPAVARAQMFHPASSQTDFSFAHVTDGGTDVSRWTTEFRIVNPNEFPVSGTLRFFTQSGGPLLVDFGSGPGSFFPLNLQDYGSARFETKGSSPTLNIGFVQGVFDAPVQATAEFRERRNGIFSNGASVDGIAPNWQFLSFADFFTGIAIANPNPFQVNCIGTFINSSGFFVKDAQIALAPLNQVAFNVGSRLNLSRDAVGSYFLGCSSAIVILAIAGNDRGITSSLPSGSVAFPQFHEANIRRLFKHLVKSQNAVGVWPVGNPQLVISGERRVNATAGNNIVTINLALAELLADSPSELAFAIAHELGHIYQASHGLTFYPGEPELDADLFATTALLFSGYDPYAGAGVLGKLGMISKRTDIISQRFDNIFDIHTSFVNRLANIFEEIELLCAYEPLKDFCNSYRDDVHPHMPTPLRNEELEGSRTVYPRH